MDKSIPNNSCVDLHDYLKNGSDYSELPAVQISFIVAYSIVFFCGLIGNICVILSVIRNPALQTVRNFFILSLSCSDVSVICFSGSISLVSMLKKVWLFGAVLCYFLPLCQGMSLFISIFTLTCIALDRYRLICHPAERPITGRQALLMILFVWILAFTFSVPTAIHQDFGEYNLPFENQSFCGDFCFENWQGSMYKAIYGWTLIVFQFVIPFLIMALCYYFILRQVAHGVLLRGTEHMAKSELTARQKTALAHKQRTNRMLIAMVVAFGVSWLPTQILGLLRDLMNEEEFRDLISGQESFLTLVVHFIAMTSTVWNPILYAGLNEQYRRAFLEIIPCLGRLCNSPVLRKEFHHMGSEIRRDKNNQDNLSRRSFLSLVSVVDDEKHETCLVLENSLAVPRNGTSPHYPRPTFKAPTASTPLLSDKNLIGTFQKGDIQL